ncbi:MAG: hypothetical protein ACK4F8_02505 [Aquabacterium sp.]
MPTITRTLTAASLAFASLMVSMSAHAAPQRLSDEEMSEAYAGDGTVDSNLPNSPFLAFANQITQLASLYGKVLTREEFLATMAASGVNNLPTEVYNGQTVSEVTLPSNPVSRTMNLSQFISNMTGVKYDAPKMGTISIQNFDAGGTRLWVWSH